MKASCRKQLAAVLLCSGLSRRMGTENKLLMEFKGRELYRHIGEKIASRQELLKYIVTCYDDIAEWGALQGFCVLDNRDAAEGIAASIRLAAERAKLDGADGLLFCNGDQPLLSLTVIERVIAEFVAKDKIIVPCCEGQPSSPCMFPKRFFDELTALNGDTGGRKVYNRHLTDVVFINFADEAEFMDIDTRADLVSLKNYGL